MRHECVSVNTSYRGLQRGRRIWRRLVRPDLLCPGMDKGSGCLSVVERTIWDGDQLLYEVRADGGQMATGPTMDRAKPGTALRKAEEDAIRRGGGPGKLANKRHEMNDEAYRNGGGSVPKPGDQH